MKEDTPVTYILICEKCCEKKQKQKQKQAVTNLKERYILGSGPKRILLQREP